MTLIFDDYAQKIIAYIGQKKKFTELELKKRLKIDLQTIRRILYKLQEKDIVYPIGTLMRGNRYDYRWGVKYSAEEIFKMLAEEELKKIEEEKARQPQYVFVCEDCNIVLDFDQAEEYDMRCPECGAVLDMRENFRLRELLILEKKIKKFIESLPEKLHVQSQAAKR